MKYNIIFFCFLFLSCTYANAQEIKVNENKFITILFDSNVTQGAIGNNDFTLEYSDDASENIVLIKANSKNAKSTNLVIKTQAGYLYNIDLTYGNPEKNSIQFGTDIGLKIGNFKNLNTNSSSTISVKSNIKENDYTIGETVMNDSYINNDCSNCPKILDTKKIIKRITTDAYSINITLENLFYSENKLYLVITISNDSNIDYNINYIKTYLSQGKDSKVSTAQYLEKNPINIYNTKRTIKGLASQKMIFIYDQFTIDDNKNLIFELNESNGERNLFLKIPSYIINKPFNFNIKK
ncbi:hypothetical protein BWK57_11800 [Flavobacterium columnare]|uniref:DUF4138 domain-containing protein n=1 Tax=Flavobacterium columnare TaxID=996 RepID=UPI000CDA9651|nr:DUF4138 domain-containing protein [Flavobacterium columnare]POR20970.1 hypothetical protein BWK57_11800 [Flavobacterium columnare]